MELPFTAYCHFLPYEPYHYMMEQAKPNVRSRAISTIKDVAREAGVSTATVSHVINKTRFVSPMVVERVKNAIKKVKYKPNRAARTLRTRVSRMIGVVIYSNMNPYYAEILHWINRACTESNYSTLVSYSMDSQVGDRESIERLIDRGVDGLILNITQEDETILPYLYELDIPFVLMNRHFPDLNQDTIYNDDYLGGSLAMNHLLELGHRRIGIACYLTVPSHSYVQRYAAYKDSLEIAGITFDPKLVYNCDFEKENGYKAMEYFLEMEDRPTGIFFCGDILAIGAYKSAFERGVRIPEDISLVGYDNIDYSGYMIPPLTTIDQDCKAIGNRAVENLLIRIDDENQKAQHLSIAPNLIVRNSTAKLK